MTKPDDVAGVPLSAEERAVLLSMKEYLASKDPLDTHLTVVGSLDRILDLALTAPAAPREESVFESALRKVRGVLSDSGWNGNSGKPTSAQIQYMKDTIDNALALPHPRPGAEGAEPVASSVYESAVNGRREFRAAYSKARDRIKALEAEVEKWKTIAANEMAENTVNVDWIHAHVCEQAPADAGDAAVREIRHLRELLSDLVEGYTGYMILSGKRHEDTEKQPSIRRARSALAAAEPQDMGGR